MAAVIGPVCIDELQFGDRGVPAEFLEMSLEYLQILHIHGEAVGFVDSFQFYLAAESDKAGEHSHIRRGGMLLVQCFGLVQRRFTGFHRVDQVALDGDKILGG